MMGVWRPCRSSPHKSNPLVSGSMMSSTTRSGAATFTRFSAALPLVTQSTSKPSKVRLSRNTRASDVSSSTTRIRFFIIFRDWQRNRDGGADVHFAENRELAVVIGDDALDDREAESAAIGIQPAAAEEFARHQLDFVFRNPTPLVADLEHDPA